MQAEIDEVDALLDRSRANFKKKWEYELARIQVNFTLAVYFIHKT